MLAVYIIAEVHLSVVNRILAPASVLARMVVGGSTESIGIEALGSFMWCFRVPLSFRVLSVYDHIDPSCLRLPEV
jgi:hypothetical protein